MKISLPRVFTYLTTIVRVSIVKHVSLNADFGKYWSSVQQYDSFYVSCMQERRYMYARYKLFILNKYNRQHNTVFNI